MGLGLDCLKMDIITNRSLLFYVGEKFDSFEALTSKLDAYCRAAYVHYWTRDSRKIGCARILRHIDEKLKYYSLKYTCVLGGQAFHSRGTGQRYSFSIRANNCPAHISIRASKDGMYLEVISVNNDHNHDQSQEIFQALPKERRLPDNIKAEILDLIKMQIDRRRVKEYVRLSTQKVLTTKDLTNLISAGRLDNRPDLTAQRSEELLAKVYSDEMEAALSRHSTYGVVRLKEEKICPKAKKQCIPSYFLKPIRDNQNIRNQDSTAEDYVESDAFIQIHSSPLHSSYELPTVSSNTHTNTLEEVLETQSSPTSSPIPDVIVEEDSAHFCVTCGQVLPENHRLLQPLLNPNTVFESVFLSPIEQIGMVEEVVSTVDIASRAECVGQEERASEAECFGEQVSEAECFGEQVSEAVRRVAECSREGVVTVKEEDFEDFVQRSLQS